MDSFYEVYETDADDTMEVEKMKYRGRCFDLAESKLLLLFRSNYPNKDYLIYNATTREVVCACLTPTTMEKKGICPQ
jgi:hypothetical protein